MAVLGTLDFRFTGRYDPEAVREPGACFARMTYCASSLEPGCFFFPRRREVWDFTGCVFL